MEALTAGSWKSGWNEQLEAKKCGRTPVTLHEQDVCHVTSPVLTFGESLSWIRGITWQQRVRCICLPDVGYDVWGAATSHRSSSATGGVSSVRCRLIVWRIAFINHFFFLWSRVQFTFIRRLYWRRCGTRIRAKNECSMMSSGCLLSRCTDFKSSKKSLDFWIFSELLDFFGFFWIFRIFSGIFFFCETLGWC